MASPSLPAATIVITPRERHSVALRTLELLIANTTIDHRGIYVCGGAPPAIERELERVCAAHGYEFVARDTFLAPNAARNLGLARCETEYVVFLDNDVIVESGWLEALIRCADEESADLVSPLILSGEPVHMHSLGGVLDIHREGDTLSIHENHHVRQVAFAENFTPLVRVATDYSEFHCALVRRSVFALIGKLDEKIEGAAEHIDLAMHLRAIGARGFAEPASVVSYIDGGYTLADLPTYSVRWGEAWFGPTMSHLAAKWKLSPHSKLLPDYRSSFRQLRERCLLRGERNVTEWPQQGPAVAQTIVQLLDQMERSGYEAEDIVRIRDAYLVAAALFAAGFRSSGRTFLAHLVGTASLVAAVHASTPVIAAALLHAAYTHANFPSGFDGSVDAMRRWLTRRVGDSVEALVFAYSHLRPQDVGRYVSGDIEQMPVVYANATLIRIANAIEDRVAGDHRYFDSSAWLTKSNAEVVSSLPAFTAVADRLGVGPLAALLKRSVALSETGPPRSPLRPARPLNYTIDPTSGMMHPLPARSISLEQSKLGSNRSRAQAGSPQRQPRDPDIILDIKNIQPLHEGRVTHKDEHANVVADHRPWAYSARLVVPDDRSMAGPALIDLRLQVQRGRLGVLVLERGQSDRPLATEQDSSVQPSAVTMTFSVDAIEEVGEIVLRGWPTEEPATEARIFAASITLTGASRQASPAASV